MLHRDAEALKALDHARCRRRACDDDPLERPGALGCVSKCCNSFAYSVGTPAATVTPSASINSAMLAASIFGPGNTSFAPTIGAACVKPHAPLAWNIGVIGRIESSAVKPSEYAPLMERECSTSERCE